LVPCNLADTVLAWSHGAPFTLRIALKGEPMRLAVAVWDGWISPVFDVSRRLLLIDVEGGRMVSRVEVTLEGQDCMQRASRLASLKVDTLLCGAVSSPLAAVLAANHVSVVPFLSGKADEAAAAYLEGALPGSSFSMPGCGGRKRIGVRWEGRGQGRGGPGHGRGGHNQAQGGHGQGRGGHGQGQAQGGHGQGRGGQGKGAVRSGGVSEAVNVRVGPEAVAPDDREGE
jgi:predicted Fe-Mo cluster-binding NifX family protein